MADKLRMYIVWYGGYFPLCYDNGLFAGTPNNDTIYFFNLSDKTAKARNFSSISSLNDISGNTPSTTLKLVMLV